MSALLQAPVQWHSCWMCREPSRDRLLIHVLNTALPWLFGWDDKTSLKTMVGAGCYQVFQLCCFGWSRAAVGGSGESLQSPSCKRGLCCCLCWAEGNRPFGNLSAGGLSISNWKIQGYILETIDRNLLPRFWRSPKPPSLAAQAWWSRAAVVSAPGSPVPLLPGSFLPSSRANFPKNWHYHHIPLMQNEEMP